MKLTFLLALGLLFGCSDASDMDQYVCSDQQLERTRKQSEDMMRFGYDGVWAYRHAVIMNCDLKK